MITVVGLGAEKGDLTKTGEEAILAAKKVIVRTALTRSYENLKETGAESESLDFLYEKSRNFQTLNKKLAAAVKAAEKEYGDVVYCVDGSAAEDASVKELLKKRGEIRLVGGVSKGTKCAEFAGFSSCSYAACSAYDLEEAKKGYGLTAPLVVYDVDDEALAGDVKLLLSDAFGEETDVTFVAGGKTKKIKLYELDRMKKYDYSSAVCVDSTPLLKKTRFSLQDLENIIVRLRRPDGCPWDRAQTPDSVKMSAVEEAYELLDAIDSGDPDKILEETGDVLMQVVFHAVMQEERGAFNLGDVLFGVCEKLIARHTHVFGEDKASDEKGALSVWEKNKMKEKGQERYADAVNDVPKCFPALLQAQKIVKRMEKGGMIYSFEETKEKLLASLEKLRNAMESGEEKSVKEELGEYLMWTATLCKKTGADGEEALLEQLKKTKRTYEKFESLVLADGKDVNALTKEEREEYLRRAEAEE